MTKGARWTRNRYRHKKCGYEGKLRIVHDGYYCPGCKLYVYSNELELITAPKLSKSEKFVLKYLAEAYKKYPQPLRTVHSAFGIAGYSISTNFSRGIKYWLKILKKLEKKGLVKTVKVGFNEVVKLTEKGKRVSEEIKDDNC